MTILQAIIPGIIEGITEFLPISSTGHMILISTLLHIPQTSFVKSFEIIIQLGAILSVCVLYFRKLSRFSLISKPLIYACLPAFIVGGFGYKIIKHMLLGNPFIVIAALSIGGLIMIIFDLFWKYKSSSYENLSVKNSIIIGLFQSISMIPGVSRSAATIIGGVIVGLSKKQALEFSFLLAIPTMLAASSIDIIQSGFSYSLNEYFILAIGFITSYIISLLTIKIFLRFVESSSFLILGIYRILIAGIFYIVIRG
jgi:undecaprenyl-diphosphatase